MLIFDSYVVIYLFSEYYIKDQNLIFIGFYVINLGCVSTISIEIT